MTANLDFEKEVIAASQQQPVVVDFWAEWCGPCKMLGPILEKLDREANGAWKLVKVNTDLNPQISAKYGIRGIPAVKMFHKGEIVAEFVGALPEVQVRRWLEQHLPSQDKQLLSEATAAFEAGDRERARELLGQILQQQPDHIDARILMARLQFESEPARARELVTTVPEEHPQATLAQAIETLCRLEMEYERIAQAAGPGEAWRHYLDGIQALRVRDYDKALQHWIEALTIDKSIDDDGPRRACVAVFNYLGRQHELTQKYHRAFTSALF